MGSWSAFRLYPSDFDPNSHGGSAHFAMVVGGNVVAWDVEEIGNRIVNGDEPNPIMMRVAGEKLIALLIAIGLLRAAKGIDWVGELVADAVVWIINQCDPKTRRRT